jgi:uncharacterized protein (TIGR00369 family)
MATMFENIHRMMRGELPAPPVAGLIGFTVVSAEPGKVTCRMQTDPARHGNPMGTVHGGVLCDIADAAMGLAHASLLKEGESFTTLELKINFLRPVWNATLTATGEVVKAGSTVSLVECSIVDERDRLVARCSSTCLTLRGDQARGR